MFSVEIGDRITPGPSAALLRTPSPRRSAAVATATGAAATAPAAAAAATTAATARTPSPMLPPRSSSLNANPGASPLPRCWSRPSSLEDEEEKEEEEKEEKKVGGGPNRSLPHPPSPDVNSILDLEVSDPKPDVQDVKMNQLPTASHPFFGPGRPNLTAEKQKYEGLTSLRTLPMQIASMSSTSASSSSAPASQKQSSVSAKRSVPAISLPSGHRRHAVRLDDGVQDSLAVKLGTQRQDALAALSVLQPPEGQTSRSGGGVCSADTWYNWEDSLLPNLFCGGFAGCFPKRATGTPSSNNRPNNTARGFAFTDGRDESRSSSASTDDPSTGWSSEVGDLPTLGPLRQERHSSRTASNLEPQDAVPPLAATLLEGLRSNTARAKEETENPKPKPHSTTFFANLDTLNLEERDRNDFLAAIGLPQEEPSRVRL
eukprot:CAMPEP_0206485796 /NCGR_PEP_ID=MMETSP0324_2-20121206/40703_1 /ASSEMBLY_ACC=CAM_ASM_000836 /TAXON_ID=2866 /ORGANISM="Crypthecodinium cohnii, Strain Seligo" /LENGTH=429 /DNA_ID=CAMNT_0053964043 /DNA_START=221 /DNA_END=1510 /DNA_ORIENTATION=+